MISCSSQQLLLRIYQDWLMIMHAWIRRNSRLFSNKFAALRYCSIVLFFFFLVKVLYLGVVFSIIYILKFWELSHSMWISKLKLMEISSIELFWKSWNIWKHSHWSRKTVFSYKLHCWKIDPITKNSRTYQLSKFSTIILILLLVIPKGNAQDNIYTKGLQHYEVSLKCW